MALFALISRWGTRIIALAAIVGILAQSLAAELRPVIGPCVVMMLTLSLLRVDLSAFLSRVRRPGPAIAAAVWSTVAIPLAVLSVATLSGPLAGSAAALAVLFLFSAPPPIVSAPALAMLIGLDGAMVLAVMLLATVSMPLTTPLVASLFVAETLPVSALDLAVRLTGLIGTAIAVAALGRALLGPRRIAAGKPVFDTLSVAVAVLFGLGAMDGVGTRLLAEPVLTSLGILGSFAFSIGQMALTYLAFRPFVGADALAIAYAAASRNSGLVVAALGVTAVSDTVWLFFALSQLPIFFFPLVLKPLGRRLTASAAATRTP